jgi:thiol-disulfide isomerase/thioredoxin
MRRNAKVSTGWLLLSLSLALFFAPPAGRAQNPSPAKQKASTKPTASADPPIITLDGYNALLKKYRGQPILVNMWATWCEPCRFEYPMLVDLERENAPKGLVVLGVSFDEDADMNLVRHFLARHHPGFQNFREKRAEEQAFIHGVNPAWNGSLPATLFYDRTGHLAGQFIGTRPRADFEQMIQTLLAGAHAQIHESSGEASHGAGK